MSSEKNLISFIRDYYNSNNFIPLHAPFFSDREKEYVIDTISTTFVSSVGHYVDRFENEISTYTCSDAAVACVNGTSALHICLQLAGVESGDLVITQPLTFVGTCNAIRYCGADPIFVDVDLKTLSLSALAMDDWLDQNALITGDGFCRQKSDGRKIKACVPMHTFGHPADIENLLLVAKKWQLVLVEDAAESLGSFYKDKHTGTFADLAALSFNGNKIITTGGGGMILSKDKFALTAKHLTTTAKVKHPYEFIHDEVGYNYRLPSINAALGCAQLEKLEDFIAIKRSLAKAYEAELVNTNFLFVKEPYNCRSNYWLNAVICESLEHRNEFLKFTNDLGIMTRPVWKLMNNLPVYKYCTTGDIVNSNYFADRVVNLPSSVNPAALKKKLL